METKDLYQTTPIQNRNYAGFGSRFVAHIIDGAILSVGLGILSWITGIQFNSGIVEIIYSPGGWLSFFLVMAYFIYFESGPKQATIGKSIMGLKVVKQNGTKMTSGDAFVRYLGKMVSAIIFMIGFIMVFFDDQKKSLHDRIASTFVIKE